VAVFFALPNPPLAPVTRCGHQIFVSVPFDVMFFAEEHVGISPRFVCFRFRQHFHLAILSSVQTSISLIRSISRGIESAAV